MIGLPESSVKERVVYCFTVFQQDHAQVSSLRFVHLAPASDPSVSLDFLFQRVRDDVLYPLQFNVPSIGPLMGVYEVRREMHDFSIRPDKAYRPLSLSGCTQREPRDRYRLAKSLFAIVATCLPWNRAMRSSFSVGFREPSAPARVEAPYGVPPVISFMLSKAASE